MLYDWAIEKHDISRIDKLNTLKNPETFNDDIINKFTKNIRSDHAIRRWECLSEIRQYELENGLENVSHEEYNAYIQKILDNMERRYKA